MRYSLNAYRLTLKLRSSKTVLVEGSTDKKVLDRFLMIEALRTGTAANCVVDEASLLQDSLSLFGLGNKQKVLAVANVTADLREKFTWMIDREWEDMDPDTVPPTVGAQPAQQYGYVTKGHSMENYWFLSAAMENYLRFMHGADVPPGLLVRVRARFIQMIRLALAFSIVAKTNLCIERCGALVGSRHISWVGAGYELLATFDNDLHDRGLALAFSQMVRAKLVQLPNGEAEILELRWMCHGHLGEEMLRACVASEAAGGLGVEAATVTLIERGNKNVKFAHDADYICSLDAASTSPLWDVVAWAA